MRQYFNTTISWIASFTDSRLSSRTIYSGSKTLKGITDFLWHFRYSSDSPDLHLIFWSNLKNSNILKDVIKINEKYVCSVFKEDEQSVFKLKANYILQLLNWAWDCRLFTHRWPSNSLLGNICTSINVLLIFTRWLLRQFLF